MKLFTRANFLLISITAVLLFIVTFVFVLLKIAEVPESVSADEYAQ